MKFRRLIGLGMLAAPVAATGAAQAQTPPAPEAVSDARDRGCISRSLSGRISDSDYSYTVEEIFPVEADVGDGYVIDAAFGMQLGGTGAERSALTWQDRDNANAAWQFGTETGPGMSAYTLDAIGFYDIPINSRANFYVGAGVGIGSVTIDDGVIADSTGTGLHLQAIAGVEAHLSGNLAVFVEGRLRSLRPSVEAGQAGASGRTDGFDISSGSISAGVKFKL